MTFKQSELEQRVAYYTKCIHPQDLGEPTSELEKILREALQAQAQATTNELTEKHRQETATLVATFGHGTGGKKIRKKVNQVYGRQLRDLAMESKKELDMEVARRLAHFNSMVREKPTWVPTIVWRWLQNMVLKNDTMV